MRNTCYKFSISLFLCASLLSGCAALGTAVSHHELETQTLMSQSIFMEPVTNPQDKTLFISVHNTTDKSIEITRDLQAALEEKGYRIVNSPQRARYLLQVNLLQFGKNSMTAAKEQMESGYGGTLEGALVGGAVAVAANASSMATVAAGVAGGVVSTVGDNLVKDVTYSGIVDIKITDRTHGKVVIYQTRILTTADQVNLRFENAVKPISAGLCKSISGIFN